MFVPGSAYKQTPKAKQAAFAKKAPAWMLKPQPKGPTPTSKRWKGSL